MPSKSLLPAFLAFALASTSASSAFAESESPTILVVDADETSQIDRDALRDTLARDLRTSVEARDATSNDASSAQILVQLRGGHTVFVTYRNREGKSLSRAIEVTGDRAALASAAALLAENLAHDQTSELLANEKASAAAAAKKSEAATNEKASAEASKEAEKAEEPGPVAPVIVSFFYPLASNWGKPNTRTPFELDVLHGRNGGIFGAQISGLVGASSGSVQGAQVTGIAGIAKDVTGGQIAGVVNVGRDVGGAQIAGAVNVANDVTGAQISVVNVGGNVDGAQIGVVNVGKRVRGTQVGVVNVADEVEGASVGIIDYVKQGHVRGVAWGSLAGKDWMGNAGIQWSSKYAYTIVHGTYAEDHVGPGLRIGAHIPIQRFYVDGDVGTSQLFLTTSESSDAAKASPLSWPRGRGYGNHEARVLIGFDVTKFMSVFAGGGLSVAVAQKSPNDVTLRPVLAAGLSIGN